MVIFQRRNSTKRRFSGQYFLIWLWRIQHRFLHKYEKNTYIYNPKETQTASGKTITRFGMKVWCGKGKDGKNIYEFVNCKFLFLLLWKHMALIL
mgnify:CR=1 FL=1